jgi:signal transduction histidine kinase
MRLRQEQDAELTRFINEFSEINNPLNMVGDYRFPIKAYDNGKLIYWSSNQYLPDIQTEDLYSFDSDTTFLVLRKSLVYRNAGLLEFYSFLELGEPVMSTTTPSRRIFGDFIINIKATGQFQFPGTEGVRFDIVQPGNKPVMEVILESMVLVVSLLSLITILIYFAGISTLLVWLTFALILALRLIQLWYIPTYEFIEGALFNPIHYTQSRLNISLGDLMLNLSLIILGLFLFINSRSTALASIRFISKGTILKLLVAFVLMITGILSSFIAFESLKSLNIDSQIQLDISESLLFSVLRSSIYLTILMIGFAYALINLMLWRLYVWIYKKEGHVVLVPSLIAMMVMYWVLPEYSILTISLHTVIWISMFLLTRIYTIGSLTWKSTIYLIFMSLVLGATHALSVYKSFEENEIEKKANFTTQILIGRDIVAEYYLTQLEDKLQRDPFIRTRFLNAMLPTDQVLSYVKREAGKYLERYDLGTYLYDKQGNPYGVTNLLSFNYWIENKALVKIDQGESIYRLQDRSDGRFRYVMLLNIGEPLLGYLVVELTQLKYVFSSVFPAALSDRPSQPDNYDYAIYDKGILRFKQGTYAFDERLTNGFIKRIESSPEGFEEGEYHYLGRKMIDDNLIVVVSNNYEERRILANFSFVFILCLLVIGIGSIIASTNQKWYNWSLSRKIQWYAAMILTIPIIIIGTVIMNVLNDSYRDEINKNYQKRALNVAENVVSGVVQFANNETNRASFNSFLENVSRLARADLIIYNTEGSLLGTNREEVFEERLLSRSINPSALYQIRDNGSPIVSYDEEWNGFDYKSVYTGIYNLRNGELVAILSLPYFDYKNHLGRQQVEVFGNIITLFTIIFLLTIVIANISLNSIINPIRFIADRLRRVNYLEDEFEPLKYRSKDELGLLVSEYNSMLSKLKSSKEELARVQKESAWKEIAQQVAHEIKNPLTPMRLKIQQLLRNPEIDHRMSDSLKTLLAQVDSLNSIADSFSAFAQMPAPNVKTFNWSQLVQQIVSLHQENQIRVTSELTPNLHVDADEKQLGQILNNLIINALQSIDEPTGHVHVTLTGSKKKSWLKIIDSGEGIPDDIQHKVFKPYFSTKEKGSGIGLALAKKGIEQAQGNIWFEKNKPKGTIFNIVLPLSDTDH